MRFYGRRATTGRYAAATAIKKDAGLHGRK